LIKRVVAVLSTALLFASCAQGDTTESIPTTSTQAVTTTVPVSIPEPVVTTPVEKDTSASLKYTPVQDGFSFENFGGGEAPAGLTVNMTRRFYGDNQVCSDVTDNECTPYPVILQLIAQANRSMKGGLCEGLTVLSLRLANDPLALAEFQNAEQVATLIKEDPALLSEIAYWYVTQFAIEVQQQAAQFLELSPLALARILYEDFAKAEAGEPSVGYTIGIYSEQGGHAVTPYKVTTDGNTWRIYIYDSNWATTERWIDVNENGWSYALAATNPTEQAEAWGGGTGTMELTPMTSRSGPFTCSFCPQEEDQESGTLLTVAASGSKQMAIQIETETGNRLGYYDGKFVNEIEGATYRYLISGTSTADPVMVFLPPNVEDFSADVDVINIPTPADTPTDAPAEGESVGSPPEQEQEQDSTQQFSLLILDEEKSVQIEADIVIEEQEQEQEVESLIHFSEEAVEIADIEEATVAIAIDALEVEIEVEQGQQIAVQFVPEPPPVIEAGQSPPVIEAPTMLDISIADNTGELLAEVEVDLTPFRVEDRQEEIELEEEPEQAPVMLAISFDEEIGEVEQVEESIEAWVASDAEYFQAIIEDRVEEVLGETWVEELEETQEWEIEEEFEQFDLTEILLAVEEDYWEDEIWEEIDYDEEWFEEEAELELFVIFEEEEWWDEEPQEWMEEDEWFEEEWFDPEQLFEEFEEQEIEEIIDEVWFEEEITEEEWEELEEPEGLWEQLEELEEEFIDDEFWLEEEEWFEDELVPTTTWIDDWDYDEFGEIPLEMLEWSDEEFDLFETFLDNTPEEEEEEELEVWELDPFLNTEEEWEEWEDEFWFEDSEIEDDWIEDWLPEEEIEEDEFGEIVFEEEIEQIEEVEADEFSEIIIEEEWDNPYEDCIGTSACENAPSGFDTWAQWESANNPNYVAPEVGDADYVPPPPPPPLPVYWTYSEDLVTSRYSDSSESTVTTVLARGTDGHWYETHTTETTTTTTTYTTNGTEQYGCVDSACASSGTTWENETSAQTVAVTTATEVAPASCSQGGFTGLGDWCIVDSTSRNDYDYIAFSVPTEAQENEACDCTDGDGLMDIRIDAESNLTRAQFSQNNEWGDPYIYLNHDTDTDDGDHSGDTDAITVGNLITQNDDGGNDCGNTCNNPPSSATDADETPNVTLTNGDPVIENVSDQWDSRITRELSAGDYVLRASVYNNANSGWYRLTIRDADVTYP
jgi:hypothetical protein